MRRGWGQSQSNFVLGENAYAHIVLWLNDVEISNWWINRKGKLVYSLTLCMFVAFLNLFHNNSFSFLWSFHRLSVTSWYGTIKYFWQNHCWWKRTIQLRNIVDGSHSSILKTVHAWQWEKKRWTGDVLWCFKWFVQSLCQCSRNKHISILI